ncbi:MAG: cobalt transporter [Tabrizicola sp.]|nr:cobalt transporter [Tabrizicola sp.]
MTQRLLTSAVIAGFAAGLVAAFLQFAFVQKLLLLGEEYETGALVHFERAAAEVGAGHAHDHDDAAADHDHAADHGGGGDGISRNALSLAFAALTYVAYGLVLVAGFALAEHYGIRVTAKEGLLWGIAGFVALQLAPALGLAPMLPGTPAADIEARQIWYIGTQAATLAGLAVLAFGRGPVKLVSILLIAAPHVIGAPALDGFGGVAPPELASAFTARAIGVTFAAWAVLGWLAGWLWAKAA